LAVVNMIAHNFVDKQTQRTRSLWHCYNIRQYFRLIVHGDVFLEPL
jgi:hypothetical protein